MKLLYILTALFLATGFMFTSVAADDYTIDSSHTFVVFKVKHLGIGYTYGRFNDISGSFSIDAEDASKSSVSVVIKTASIDTGNASRDEHLRKADFFDAKKYPEITFNSTGVKKLKTKRGILYNITGNLSLHGVTKKTTMKLFYTGEGNDPWGNYRMGFEGFFTIKRGDFGMNYMLPKGVSNNVNIIVSVEGKRKKK